MIIVICTDDATLTADARASATAHPEIFGNCYVGFEDAIPALAKDENLFIAAHGAKDGDEGAPVIGDKSQDFYLNALDLWEQLKTVYPADYTGKTFISACESQDHDKGSFSFAEVFKAQLQSKRATAGAVYGHKGGISGEIPLPGNASWKEAEI